jgi:halocyanin-like protein
MSFDPVAIRVDAGATVRWEWAGGGSAHNVAAADGSFESAYHTAEGATFERTFHAPGVVKYLCVPHEYAGMKGVIVT